MPEVTFSACRWCKHPIAILPDPSRQALIMAIDEDSLSTQEMADIEDGKRVVFDAAKHRPHVCRD